MDVLPLRNPLRGELAGVLIRRLENSDPRVRLQAVQALGEQGAKAEEAISHLIGALADPSSAVCYFAAQALGNIRAKTEYVTPALIQLMIADSNSSANSPSYAAFRALVKHGVHYPDQVVPLLINELGKDDRVRASTSQECLYRIGDKYQLLLMKYLERAVRSDNRTLRKNAQDLMDVLPRLQLIGKRSGVKKTRRVADYD